MNWKRGAEKLRATSIAVIERGRQNDCRAPINRSTIIVTSHYGTIENNLSI